MEQDEQNPSSLFKENSTSASGMSPVAGYAVKMEEAVRHVSEDIFPEGGVALIADIHTKSDFSQKFGIELARQREAAFATEYVLPSSQVFIDAFARKELTRDQFRFLCDDFYAFSEGDTLPNANPQFYMGVKRGAQFYEELTDAIESGVPVYGIGVMNQLMGPNSTPESDKLAEEFITLRSRIMLDSFQSIKSSKHLITRDDLEEAMTSHPEYSKFKEVGEKFTSEINRLKLAAEVDGSKDFYKRFSNDSAIAASIQHIREKHPNGVVGMYGLGHTSHNVNLESADIDQTLRNNGVPTVVLDPILNKTPPLSPFLDDESRKFVENPEMSHERLSIGAFDPNRFTVNLDTGDIRRSDVVLEFGRKILNNIGLMDD